MMLGRLFDPRDTGLLLTAVYGPDGSPVAMCQFVPSPAIGGYSLDLMRRDPGDHPNGLLDFALCSTITHLKERDMRGPQLELRRHAVDPRRRHGRRRHPARGALGHTAPVGGPADRDVVALQRQVRAEVAPALRRLRLGRTVRACGGADHASRIPDRGARHRPPPHDRHGQTRGAGGARGRPGGHGSGHRLCRIGHERPGRARPAPARRRGPAPVRAGRAGRAARAGRDGRARDRDRGGGAAWRLQAEHEKPFACHARLNRGQRSADLGKAGPARKRDAERGRPA